MPYANDLIGVYRLVNRVDGACYVGQSRRVKKRVADHFNLLSKGAHPNGNLQAAYSTYGREAFDWELEVLCEDPADLDSIEETFLQGDAEFLDSGRLYNISSTAKTPMTGRRHTEATKQRISEKNKARGYYLAPEFRQKLKDGHLRRNLNDPVFVARVRYILGNEHQSYAARGRHLGLDTSSVRKLAVKYRAIKEFFV
jgi:group I intron endonuclease